MDETFAEAVARLHAAMAKVANGDTTANKALYSQGWAAIEQRGLARPAL
jgi:hypothetical protein